MRDWIKRIEPDCHINTVHGWPAFAILMAMFACMMLGLGTLMAWGAIALGAK